MVSRKKGKEQGFGQTKRAGEPSVPGPAVNLNRADARASAKKQRASGEDSPLKQRTPRRQTRLLPGPEAGLPSGDVKGFLHREARIKGHHHQTFKPGLVRGGRFGDDPEIAVVLSAHQRDGVVVVDDHHMSGVAVA